MANKNPYEWQRDEAEGEGVLDEYVQAQQQLEIQRYEASIRKARNWLFASAALFVIIVLVQVGDRMHLLTPGFILVSLGFPSILVILGLLTPKKPLPCLATGLMLYVSFFIGMMVYTRDSRWLYSVLPIKLFVVAILLKGLMAAKEAKQLKYEMRNSRR